MLKRSELAGAEAISCAERIAAEAISSPDILISCRHIPSAPQGASCGDMRSAPRHKPHDKSRESVQTWSEVETCFGIVDDGDGGDALMTEIEEMPDDGDGGDALDDEHQKGEKAPEDHEEGQPEDDKEGQHQKGEEAPEDHEDDEDDKEGQAAGHDQHQKGQEAPEDDEDDKEGQAAGRAGSSSSWGGVSGQGRLEIPSRVREVVGAAYLRCLNGWRVSNLPTPGLQHVLDTVFKACRYPIPSVATPDLLSLPYCPYHTDSFPPSLPPSLPLVARARSVGRSVARLVCVFSVCLSLVCVCLSFVCVCLSFVCVCLSLVCVCLSLARTSSRFLARTSSPPPRCQRNKFLTICCMVMHCARARCLARSLARSLFSDCVCARSVPHTAPHTASNVRLFQVCLRKIGAYGVVCVRLLYIAYCFILHIACISSWRISHCCISPWPSLLIAHCCISPWPSPLIFVS